MAVLALAFAGFILLGLPDGALGVAWPSLSGDFDRSLSELGVLLVASTSGYMLATALSGPLTVRLGTGRLLLASTGTASASLFAYAAAPHWFLLLAAALFLGIGGGLIDAGVNAYVAVHHGARVMNFLHAGFGLGATLGPLLMTVALTALGSWRAGYVVLGVLQLGLGAALWRYRGRWAALPEAEQPRATTGRPKASSPLLMWGMLALFFLYTGVEVAAGQWSFTLLSRGRGVDEGVAALWVAGYWGSFTGGRLLAGVVGHRVTPERLLRASLLGAGVSSAVLWWSPEPWIGNVGLAAMGLSLAAIFPSMVLLTPPRLGAAFAPWAIGYQLSAASIGAAAVPAAVGVAVATSGLRAIGPSIFAATMAMLILAVVVERVAARPAGGVESR